MNILIQYSFLGITLFFAPILVFAQAPQNLEQLIGRFLDILSALIPLIIALALIGFLWGAAKYILAADDPTKRKEGSHVMLYGIVALFVMISVWGLVAILTGTFGITSTAPITPTLP